MPKNKSKQGALRSINNQSPLTSPTQKKSKTANSNSNILKHGVDPGDKNVRKRKKLAENVVEILMDQS
jgi:hypothetical protein